MRVHLNHSQALKGKGIFHVNFHQFLEMEKEGSSLEIAEEFGITLGEVKLLKKKVNRA